jgi:predicted nuclease of predicted toxin-antitoxin system
MTIWVDAQLSPALAGWLSERFPLVAVAARDLGLRDAMDEEIFQAAKNADAVILTKDSDFRDLVVREGPPPRVIWLTCGNTSNARLQRLLSATLPQALRCLENGDALVEIAGHF